MMLYGAQLYTVREFTQTEADFARTVEKVARIGYKWVQISGAGPIAPRKIREICDANGVGVALTHTDPQRIRLNTPEVIEEHKILGADYVGIGSMPGEYRSTAEGAARFASDYAAAIEEFDRAGLKFMYHNHNFEFERADGRPLIEAIMENLGAKAGITLDVYWVQAGGGDPAWWLERFAGRVDTIHFKDMTVSGWDQRMCEIMEGNLNWERIYDACEKAGVKWAFVEQDDCYGKDPFECLATSLRNMENFRKYDA